MAHKVAFDVAVSNSLSKYREDIIRRFIYYAFYEVGLNSKRISDTLWEVFRFKITEKAVSLRLASASKSHTAQIIREAGADD